MGAEFIIASCNYYNVDIKPKKFAIALQKVRNKKKKKKQVIEQNAQERSSHFLEQAPPAYTNLRMPLEIAPPILEEKAPITDEEKHQHLGFNEDKNIDLTKDD